MAALRCLVGFAAIALTAPAALADTPAPPCASIPCAISLVGLNAGVADPAGSFEVVVRDLACNPVEGAHVEVDFRDCAPDIAVCSSQPGAVSADCPVPSVLAITDAFGIARIRILGGARNPAGRAPGYPGFSFCGRPGTIACARIFADGVLLGVVGVNAYDQNLTGGVNPADISAWLADAFSGTMYGRSDFDGNGALSPADLARLLGVALSLGSASSCTQYCD